MESYPTGEDPFDAYWRTLICNSLKPAPRPGPSEDVIPPAELRGKWQAWEEYIRIMPEVAHTTSPLSFELRFEAYLTLRILTCLLPLPSINPLKYNSIFWASFKGLLLLFVSEFAYMLLHYILQRTLGFCFQYLQALRFSQLRDTARPFETRLEYTSGGKFCITENGYMGLVPEAAGSGDQLLVVKGSRVLFVVYPYQEGYRLLGDAYIHGLMDGEASGLPNLEFQEITLL
jgi:hypothetical protein